MYELQRKQPCKSGWHKVTERDENPEGYSILQKKMDELSSNDDKDYRIRRVETMEEKRGFTRRRRSGEYTPNEDV